MKESEAVDTALQALTRNEDGSVDEKTLIDEVAQLIDFDEAQERLNKATRAVNRRRKPRATEPEGQLTLPGMEPYGYEPNRLIADNDGHIVEQSLARPNYKQAEAERARTAARRQAIWADRKTTEFAAYAAWAIEQLGQGRRGADITFGIFVRESGLWSAGSADPEPDPDDS